MSGVAHASGLIRSMPVVTCRGAQGDGEKGNGSKTISALLSAFLTILAKKSYSQQLLSEQLKGPENLEGPEKKRTLQKHPFGQPFLRTTPSPLLWRASIIFAGISRSFRKINSVHTRCIVKTGGFTRGVCKNQGFIKFKGFLVGFLQSRRS